MQVGPDPAPSRPLTGGAVSDSSLAAMIVVGEESPFLPSPGYLLLTLTFWLADPVSPAVSVTVTVTVKLPVFVKT
jgi:hypothetical protein